MLSATPKGGIAGTELALKTTKLKSLFKENLRLIASLLAVIILLVGILLAHNHQNGSKAVSACGFRDDKTVSIGSHKIAAEVVISDKDREKGLSGRPCIGKNEGMLFVFDQPSQYQFWMKDMKFPIDIIWIGSNHRTVVAEENVKPSTYPSTRFVNPQDRPAQYVLELQAHASARLNIIPGTPINF